VIQVQNLAQSLLLEVLPSLAKAVSLAGQLAVLPRLVENVFLRLLVIAMSLAIDLAVVVRRKLDVAAGLVVFGPGYFVAVDDEP